MNRSRLPQPIAQIYRALLRAYPARARERFAAEQLRMFEQIWLEERPASPVAASLWTLRQLWLAGRAGAGLHFDELRRPREGFALHAWILDFRLAMRALRRTPWYTLTSVLVLTAGVALATVVFAVVDGVLFKPLPYPNAHELVLVRADAMATPQIGPPSVSGTEIGAWLDAAPELRATIMRSDSFSFGYFGGREYWSRRADERFFEVLGITPFLGGFTQEDFEWEPDRGSAELRPVLLSHALWQVIFGGDPAALGRSVVISERDGRQYGFTLRGVLPKDFVHPLDLGGPQPDVLVAESTERYTRSPDGLRLFQVIARIPDSASRPRIETALRGTLGRVSGRPNPHENAGQRQARRPFDQIRLVPVAEHLGQRERPAFALVMAAAALLLALAGINLAGLSAARRFDRQRDLAVRRALGASGWALTRGALAEVVVLASLSTVAAVAVAPALLALTVDMLPASIVTLKTTTIDRRVWLAAMLFGIASAAAIVVWPAMVSARLSRISGPMHLSRTATRLRRGSNRLIVATQTAFGFVLLTAGGLAAVSLAHAWSNDTGYQRDRVVMLEAFVRSYATREDRLATLERALEAFRRVPGVRRIAASTLPILKPRPLAPASDYVPLNWKGPYPGVDSRRVDANFFAITSLRLIAGAIPMAEEWSGDRPVAIVSERAAALMWPGRPAIGQPLRWAYQRENEPLREWRVVAVVADARFHAMDQDVIGDVYAPGPIAANTTGSFVFVETDGPADAVVPRLRQSATELGLFLERSMTIDDLLWTSVKHRVLPAWLFGSLGIAGLLVVLTGLLGLLAMTAAQRTRELAVRLSLGASRHSVVTLLVREQLRSTVIGLAVGALIAALTVRYLESQLYGVRAYDPAVWSGVALTMILVAVAGTVLPARRAARLDPAEILRTDV
jgi:predicted permease